MAETTVAVELALTPAQLEAIDRFAGERGIASRGQAVRLLLDIGLEAATGTGRRFWDKPIAPRADGGDEAIGRAQALAERLRAEGHATAADRLHHATAGERLGHALLEGLREACQTVLTTIEALDPKTQLMAEELRLEIDKRLSR